MDGRINKQIDTSIHEKYTHSIGPREQNVGQVKVQFIAFESNGITKRSPSTHDNERFIG